MQHGRYNECSSSSRIGFICGKGSSGRHLGTTEWNDGNRGQSECNGIEPFAMGAGRGMEDRLRSLERAAVKKERGAFRTADRIIVEMQQALGSVAQVKTDTQTEVPRMEHNIQSECGIS